MCICNKNQNPSLTIIDNGSKITHEFSYTDPNMDDWFNAFKGALVGVTFSEENVNQFIIDYAQELLESRQPTIVNVSVEIV